MLLTDAVNCFLEARTAERLSPHTLADYSNTFRKFVSYLGEFPVQEITPDHIRKFLAHQTSVKSKTLLNYHTALSSLWRWLVSQRLAAANIVREVPPPRPDIREIIPYTLGEITRLLEAVKAGKNILRDRAIVLTLLDTGIRASELVGIRGRDLDQHQRHVLVFGKGRKERQLRASPVTWAAILEYITGRGGLKRIRKDFLFVTDAGKPMNRHTLREILDRLGERSGVIGVHAHRFRHTFAIEFLRNGGNIYTLQQILGHTDLAMVKRYLYIAQMDIDRDHDRASPVARWDL